MAKQRHEVRVDRISGLPQPILQQILSPLSQAEAVRTCVLSKSWRHHWCTRPNVEFLEKSFIGKEQKFESFVNKTSQRYRDQNLSIHEFRLQASVHDSKPAAELLRKWIPALKIFNMYLLREGYSLKFDIPSPVFEAESLQKLYLERSTLNQECVANVLCKHLKTLHLVKVDIADDETLKKIISSCPLIESVTFDCCRGINTTIKVDDKLLRNLKHFGFTTTFGYGRPPRIEIDIPIERIKISYCPVVLFRNENQRNLKSLSLNCVRLSSEMLDLFSWKMPCLEFLELVSCSGFKEFHLSSRSIKHVVLHTEHNEDLINMRVTIDVPNIIYFNYTSFRLPSIFSFATTSTHKWKSDVTLDYERIDDSSWFLKLHEFLKELSGSEISLKLNNKPPLPLKPKTEDILLQDKLPCNQQPVEVDNLELWLRSHSLASRSAFVNELFGFCRPRNLVDIENTDLFLCKFLVGKKRHYSWQVDLEDVDAIMGTCYGRFRLKWREI